jgi:hypothetical protein
MNAQRHTSLAGLASLADLWRWRQIGGWLPLDLIPSYLTGIIALGSRCGMGSGGDGAAARRMDVCLLLRP